MFEDRELVAEFVNESREHLAGIESQLLSIEEAGAGAEPGLVNEVFAPYTPSKAPPVSWVLRPSASWPTSWRMYST